MSRRNSVLFITLICAAMFALSGCKNSNAGNGVEPDPETEPTDPTDTTPPPPKDDNPSTDDKGGYRDSCDTDDDCKSGLCIDNLKGEHICSIRCETTEECDDAYFRCATYDSSGADIVRACVPVPPTYCLDCQTDGAPDDSICQGYGSRCVDLGDDGFRCGRDCSSDEDACPPNAECRKFFLADAHNGEGETVYQCVPSGGYVCSDCIDADGDGYGIGGDHCAHQGLDCDDTDPYIHPGAEEQCDNVDWDCDGDPHNGFDLQSDPLHCGACETSCGAPHMSGICDSAQCIAGTCDDGFYDLNNDLQDGCEYACIDEDLTITDTPDENGADTNCDGVDGDVDLAVFVSRKGDDGADGTLSAPVRSVSKGIELAQTRGLTQVLITTGSFPETNGALAIPSGISIYGGYTTDFRSRNVYVDGTHIRPTNLLGVHVGTITEPTSIAGLSIDARDATHGNSSTAVYVDNAGAELLQLKNVTINAGAGGDGKDGRDGENGRDGNNGAGGTSSNGGAGGAGYCSNSGGAGGSSEDCNGSRSSGGKSGSNGEHAGSAGRNYCPNCSFAWDDPNYGGNGGNGADGQTGGNGSTADKADSSAGTWSGISFSAANGDDGTAGTNGTGAAGGGSGGASRPPAGGCIRSGAGGGGGGGGAGGCGGSPGSGGASGGGSFGFVIANGTPLFYQTFIYPSDGGDGGSGGNGGRGGSGGNGADGYTPPSRDASQPAPGKGGTGGDGGDGGAGSGGSGACGGPSIGIALLSGASLAADQNPNDLIIIPGDGGRGGEGGNGGNVGNTTSHAPNGPAGCTGLSAKTHTY